MVRLALLAVFFACIGCVAYLNLTYVSRAVARELRQIISKVKGIAPSAIRMCDDLAALIKPDCRQDVREMIRDRFGFCYIDPSLFETGPLLMRNLVADIKDNVVRIKELREPSQSARLAVRIWMIGVLVMTLASVIGLAVHPAVGMMLLGVTAVVAFVWHLAIIHKCRPLWMSRWMPR